MEAHYLVVRQRIQNGHALTTNQHEIMQRYTIYWIILGTMVVALCTVGVLVMRKRSALLSNSLIAPTVDQTRRAVPTPKGTRAFNSYQRALPYQEAAPSP